MELHVPASGQLRDLSQHCAFVIDKLLGHELQEAFAFFAFSAMLVLQVASPHFIVAAELLHVQLSSHPIAR